MHHIDSNFDKVRRYSCIIINHFNRCSKLYWLVNDLHAGFFMSTVSILFIFSFHFKDYHLIGKAY